MKTDIPSYLSDDELVDKVKSLARCEREATASLIAHLAELDARRLYLGAGFSSLFTYCCEVLHLSEPATYNRIEAARAARRFPVMLQMLGDGSLSLATIRLLTSHLTAENHQELLAAATGKSKRQVEELLVGYFPRPDVPDSVRKLPAAKAEPALPDATVLVASESPAVPPVASLPLVVASPPAPSARRPVVSPLAPDRYEIRFTASAQTRKKLRLAQDLLRHAIPTGDLAEVIDRALTTLLEDLARKKFAATKRPRVSRGTAPGSRDVAAKVRRAVGIRDDGACTFVSKSGRRCNARAFIEFHHVDPHAVGGETSVGNIRLLCRAHNAYESERYYGHGRPAKRATLPGKSAAPPARSFG
jgi:HNH endonuclease